MTNTPLSQIFLVPGFGEQPRLLLPLKHALRQSAATVEIWPDRMLCRNLEQSVNRLRDALLDQQACGRTVAVVTHSFGDWIVRQAIADLPSPPIEALVSIAPIIAASPMAKLLKLLGGGIFSEVPVMADADQAGKNSLIDKRIRRLVIWATFDVWIQPIEFPSDLNITVRRRWATHLSIVLQPNVHRLVTEFIQGDDA